MRLCHWMVYIGIVFMLTGSAFPNPVQDVTHTISFAESLFSEHDYYRAITEYKRAIHQTDDVETKAHAQYMIALSYFRGGQWDAAIMAFEKLLSLDIPDSLASLAYLMKGETAFQKKDYFAAIDYFHHFSTENPEHPLALDAGIRMTQSYTLIQNQNFAKQYAISLQNQFPQEERANKLSEYVRAFNSTRQKSPRLAGTLSTILPGAGQLYTGRRKDASLSFFLNSSLIAAALVAFNNDEPVAGSLISIVGLSWYTGNIYGAVNAAHKHNRDQRTRFVQNLNFSLGVMTDADNRLPSGSITISF